MSSRKTIEKQTSNALEVDAAFQHQTPNHSGSFRPEFSKGQKTIAIIGMSALAIAGGDVFVKAAASETIIDTKLVTMYDSIEPGGDTVYNAVQEILDKNDITGNRMDTILGTLDYGAALSVTPDKIQAGQEFTVTVSKNGLGIHAIKLAGTKQDQ